MFAQDFHKIRNTYMEVMSYRCISACLSGCNTMK